MYEKKDNGKIEEEIMKYEEKRKQKDLKLETLQEKRKALERGKKYEKELDEEREKIKALKGESGVKKFMKGAKKGLVEARKGLVTAAKPVPKVVDALMGRQTAGGKKGEKAVGVPSLFGGGQRKEMSYFSYQRKEPSSYMKMSREDYLKGLSEAWKPKVFSVAKTEPAVKRKRKVKHRKKKRR